MLVKVLCVGLLAVLGQTAAECVDKQNNLIPVTTSDDSRVQLTNVFIATYHDDKTGTPACDSANNALHRGFVPIPGNLKLLNNNGQICLPVALTYDELNTAIADFTFLKITAIGTIPLCENGQIFGFSGLDWLCERKTGVCDVIGHATCRTLAANAGKCISVSDLPSDAFNDNKIPPLTSSALKALATIADGNWRVAAQAFQLTNGAKGSSFAVAKVPTLVKAQRV